MPSVMRTILNSQTEESSLNNGVVRNDRKALSVKLSEALADSYKLHLKTLNVHWNISGPLFYAVHQITEQQYESIALAVDEIAERIRAIGFSAPGTQQELNHYCSLKDIAPNMGAIDMVRDLIAANETCAKNMRNVVEEAENCRDVKSADLITSQIGLYEKNAWMLRALIS
ncbi:Dps family protein [Aliikangiella maris]|uniref:Dps family protein n=2 Tax=Aliikangiella maris TaxID=3162458 RepID=A0ABV3MLJ6_9GAMM